MKVFDAADLQGILDYADLADAIDAAFKGGVTVPVRAHHTVPVEDGRDSTLLIMPAWSDTGYLGIKTVMVAPENASRGLPAVQGIYQLFDRATGIMIALMDGPELTARRTAAASAMASRYLSRPDSAKLLMVGTGVLSKHMVRAHAAVRPITEVMIWGRRPAEAARVAAELKAEGLDARPADELEVAVRWADIVSAATLSKAPLVQGAWLKPGQHLDLVGGFTPEMRETDDAALSRGRIFCDTRAGAMKEAGDLCDPLARGVIKPEDVLADLFELAGGAYRVERAAGDITIFKSAGTAIEDLAAAMLVADKTGTKGQGA